MKAFHNDPKIKKKYLARLEAHYRADEIIQGIYWENGKGCAISAYETELGIPSIIARLKARIFEGLPNECAKEFPLKFLKAVPIGADLSLVLYQFIHWLLVDETDGVISLSNEQGKVSILKVADLFKQKINGREINRDDCYAYATAAYAISDDARASTYLAAAARDYVAAAMADAASYATLVASSAAYALTAIADAIADTYNPDDYPHVAAYLATAHADHAAGVLAYIAAGIYASGTAIIASYAFGGVPSYTTSAKAARQTAIIRQADKLIELLSASPVNQVMNGFLVARKFVDV